MDTTLAKMRSGKLFRLALGIVLAAVFSWLILRHAQWADVRRAFRGADLRWIGAALLAFALGYGCRIQRWRLMLKPGNPSLRWLTCAGPFLSSFAVNNVLPFRAGDVLRSFAFNSKLGTSSGVVVATLLAERVLDLLMVLAFLAFVPSLPHASGTSFSNVGLVVALAIAAPILLMLFFPDTIVPLARITGRVARRVSPKLERAILDETQKALFTIRHLMHGTNLLNLVFWSLLSWIAEGCIFWFAALALPSIGVPLESWVALPVGTLATLIPSTPGYLGTFDYFTVRAMSVHGNPAEAAAAYALLVHALLWLPPTILGGLYLMFRKSE